MSDLKPKNIITEEAKQIIKIIKRNNLGGLPKENIISIQSNSIRLKNTFPTEIGRMENLADLDVDFVQDKKNSYLMTF